MPHCRARSGYGETVIQALSPYECLSPYERDVLPFVRPFTDALVASVDMDSIDGLLDHGAGTGAVALALRNAGYGGAVVALDPSPTMADRLRVNIGGDPATTVFEGRLAEFIAAYPAERFGLITTQLVLPFVDDPRGEV